MLLKNASGGEGEDAVVAMRMGFDMLKTVVEMYPEEHVSLL
jgi:hypothetical protein